MNLRELGDILSTDLNCLRDINQVCYTVQLMSRGVRRMNARGTDKIVGCISLRRIFFSLFKSDIFSAQILR